MKIKEIIAMIDAMLGDVTVPRNVKRAVEQAKAKLLEPGNVIVRAGTATYFITEVSEDVNLPAHARAQLWRILSALEEIRKKGK